MTTENIKLIWTDKETGEQRILLDKDLTMSQMWTTYAKPITDEELLSQAIEDSMRVPISMPKEGIDFNRLLQNVEDELIILALSSTGGNKKQAAKLLKLGRTTLVEKIRKRNLYTSEAAEITNRQIKKYTQESNDKISGATFRAGTLERDPGKY